MYLKWCILIYGKVVKVVGDCYYFLFELFYNYYNKSVDNFIRLNNFLIE